MNSQRKFTPAARPLSSRGIILADGLSGRIETSLQRRDSSVVEQQFRKLLVAGSNPARASKLED